MAKITRVTYQGASGDWALYTVHGEELFPVIEARLGHLAAYVGSQQFDNAGTGSAEVLVPTRHLRPGDPAAYRTLSLHTFTRTPYHSEWSTWVIPIGKAVVPRPTTERRGAPADRRAAAFGLRRGGRRDL